MKKVLLTLVFLTLSSLFCSAQIQREFFGLYLGEATQKKAEQTIKDLGYRIVNSDNTGFSLKNLRFGGITWDFVSFHFQNNKFYLVSFMESNQTSSNEYVSLKEKLMGKYQEFIEKDKATNTLTSFKDDKTTLLFFVNELGMVLSYGDNKLTNTMIKEADDEL